MQVCRLTATAAADLNQRIGFKNAKAFAGVLNLRDGEVVSPDGSRRAVNPADIEIASWVEIGEKTMIAKFKSGTIETFTPYWAK
jgi:hypothetical protein